MNPGGGFQGNALAGSNGSAGATQPGNYSPVPPQNQGSQQPQQSQGFAQAFDEMSASQRGAPPVAEPGSAAYRGDGGQQGQGAVGQPVQTQQPAPPAIQPPAQLPVQQQLPPGATTNPPRDIVQNMRSRGYPVPDDWNDDLLLGELGTLVDSLRDAPSQDELQRYKQLAPQLYEFAQHRPDFDRWMQERQGQGQQGQGQPGQAGQIQPSVTQTGQPAQQPPLFQAPTVDPFASQLVEMGEITRDEKGIYSTRRPELASYASQLNARESHVRRFRSEFETDPHGFIQKAIDPFIAEKVKPYEEEIKQLKQSLAQQSQQSSAKQIEDYFQQNSRRFWMFDQNGQRVFGPDGMPMMTQEGHAYANAIGSLEPVVKDPLQRHQAALKWVDSTFQQPIAQPAQQQFGQFQQAPVQQSAQQPVQQFAQQPIQQQTAAEVQHQRNLNFLHRNRINQQFARMPSAGYPNQLPQGGGDQQTNSFGSLFDQEEALRS